MRKLLFVLFVGFGLVSCSDSSDQGKTANLPTPEEIKESADTAYGEIIELHTKLKAWTPDTGDEKEVKQIAAQLQTSSQVFVNANGNDPRAMEVEEYVVASALTLGRFVLAVRHLDKLIEKYPENEKVVEFMFQKAFILQQTKRMDEAKTAFQAVADKFPDHELGKNSLLVLETIDLSDEELINKFQE